MGIQFIPGPGFLKHLLVVRLRPLGQLVSPPAAGPLFQGRRDKNLQVGVGSHHCTDVPAHQHYFALLGQGPLLLDQGPAHLGYLGHQGHAAVHRRVP